MPAEGVRWGGVGWGVGGGHSDVNAMSDMQKPLAFTHVDDFAWEARSTIAFFLVGS